MSQLVIADDAPILESIHTIQTFMCVYNFYMITVSIREGKKLVINLFHKKHLREALAMIYLLGS